MRAPARCAASFVAVARLPLRKVLTPDTSVRRTIAYAAAAFAALAARWRVLALIVAIDIGNGRAVDELAWRIAWRRGPLGVLQLVRRRHAEFVACSLWTRARSDTMHFERASCGR